MGVKFFRTCEFSEIVFGITCRYKTLRDTRLLLEKGVFSSANRVMRDGTFFNEDYVKFFSKASFRQLQER